MALSLLKLNAIATGFWCLCSVQAGRRFLRVLHTLEILICHVVMIDCSKPESQQESPVRVECVWVGEYTW